MQQSEVHSRGPRSTQITLSKKNNDAVAVAVVVVSGLSIPILPSVDFIPCGDFEPLPK